MSARYARALILLFAAAFFFHAMATKLPLRPFPFEGMDEPAHAAYTEHLGQNDLLLPDFDDFPMSPTNAQQNYLNHPPHFYLPLASTVPNDAATYRHYAFLFAALIAALYFAFGMQLRASLGATALYAAFPFLLSAEHLLGFYNNDLWGILGGVLACFGSYRWLQHPNSSRAHWLIAFGLLFASAKFTALLLVGIYLACVYMLHPQRSNRLVIFIACALAAAPYAYFLYRYGSPVPDTAGKRAILQHYAAAAGWPELPPLIFIDWLIFALISFARVHAGLDLTWAGLLLLIASWVALRAMPRSPAAIIARAACIATLLVLLVHLGFSYQRYVAYAWLKDFYVRYYFPLLPAYGLGVMIAADFLWTKVSKTHATPRE